jgi:cardiolipin synthase
LSGCATRLQISQLPDIRLGDPSFFPTIAADTNAPILGGNRVRILLNGDETFPAMLREIRTAKQTINFAQYLYGEGKISYEFAEAFAERCRAGVKVNILLDSYGADDIPVDIPELMKRAGCNAEFFHRIKILQFITPWELFGYNYRSHRRVLVIDGRIGFTGGYGISAAWTGDGRTPEHWRDTNVEVEGPIVQWLQAAFVDSWHETTGILLGGDKYFPHLEPRGDMLAQVVKSSPLAGSSESYTLFLLSISSAKKSILISNPYFIPDEHIAEALVKAVARGVRVIVLVPNKIDNPLTHAISRSGYGPLLRGGVQIYEYTAALLHSKTMVIDGTWATIGSTNLDSRSLALNEELNLTVYNSSLANRLEQIFYQDLKYARQVSLKEWNSRSLAERFLELFAFPLKDQL